MTIFMKNKIGLLMIVIMLLISSGCFVPFPGGGGGWGGGWGHGEHGEHWGGDHGGGGGGHGGGGRR